MNACPASPGVVGEGRPARRSPDAPVSLPSSCKLRPSAVILLLLSLAPVQVSCAGDEPELGPDATVEQVRAVVAQEMRDLERTHFRIDGVEHELVDLEPADDGFVLLFETQALLLGVRRSGAPNGRVELHVGVGAATENEEPSPDAPVLEGKLRRSRPDGDIRLHGRVSDPEGAHPDVELDLRLNEALFGAGTTRLEIEGTRAILRGVLGSRSHAQLDALIREHPEVRTLVLQDVPGSMNDEVNVHAGRLVRAAGLTTLIPANGMAASGGVDLFAAGVTRVAEPGARLGIHAWCCWRGKPAEEIERGHRAHAHQEAYFREMMGARGIDFYYRTLEAAPFDDIHWMSRSEMESSGLLTARAAR